MEQSKVKIGFEFTDHFDNEYYATSYVDVFESDFEEIGEKLNAFLRQIGYPRSRDYIFMEDLTETELELIATYLRNLRDPSIETTITTSPIVKADK